MNQQHTIHLSSWARIVLLSLLLGVGVLASLGLSGRTAHAQSAATIAVTSCDDATLRSAIANAASGDTITFGCSGDILLTSTLEISKNLTLDGSGQKVTLDGGNKVQVLLVETVSFALKALTIAHGLAQDGGGLLNAGEAVSITNSTFASNSASAGNGGGLFTNGGILSITNSTFANNTAGSHGGGIYNSGGTVNISNSTFASNSASAGNGGGLFTYSTMSIGGSIVANNTGGDCGGTALITDKGYNLESGTDCGFMGTGDLQNTDPKLDPNSLQNNGGPTQTIALLSTSPAIDRIPAASCPATDQRGDARLDNAETACDMGAYEFSDLQDTDLGLTNMPSNITVNATSPQGAKVTYTPPTATDESGDSSTASVSCTPASGSTFAIGTTTVTCTATDSDDANSPVIKSFTVTVKDTDLGLSNLPSNIMTDATSPQGAVVTYTPPTVVDEDSSGPSASCTPASGSIFAIGTTTVTCTASDSDDTPGSVSQSFTVTVKDLTAPVLSLPSTITVDATSPQGASVTYMVTATDPDNAASDLTISCSPASGSTFAIGTTTVKCSASDPAGNKATGSFSVVVKGAATQVSDLVSLVNSYHLSSSLQTALDNKLQDVLTAIKAGQTATACSELTDFTGFVQSHTSKGITQSQATQLIAAAKQVQAVLGC